jgi:uncharacterized protein (UPF0332 family)
MMDEEARQDIVNYRCQKAHELMHDVDVLIENELWNSAVNRMYYACFHIVSALLVLHGIEVKSHMGVRQAFGLHFVKSGLLSLECGRMFSRLYDKRQSSDYDDFREFSKEEVENLYPQALFLIENVSQLITSR